MRVVENSAAALVPTTLVMLAAVGVLAAVVVPTALVTLAAVVGFR